jgi:hypothetical protein
MIANHLFSKYNFKIKSAVSWPNLYESESWLLRPMRAGMGQFVHQAGKKLRAAR